MWWVLFHSCLNSFFTRKSCCSIKAHANKLADLYIPLLQPINEMNKLINHLLSSKVKFQKKYSTGSQSSTHQQNTKSSSIVVISVNSLYILTFTSGLPSHTFHFLHFAPPPPPPPWLQLVELGKWEKASCFKGIQHRIEIIVELQMEVVVRRLHTSLR